VSGGPPGSKEFTIPGPALNFAPPGCESASSCAPPYYSMEPSIELGAPIQPPLPFKPPAAFWGIPANSAPVVITSWKFLAKMVTLNTIVARYIGMASDVTWAKWLYFFPVVSLIVVINVTAEFAAREWVYYRLLEHGVLLQFEPQESIASLLRSTGTLWMLTGTVLLTGIMVYVNHSQLSDSSPLEVYHQLPVSEIISVLVQASLVIHELYSTRQITKRLVTINTLVNAADKDGAIEWLRGLEAMDEKAVQFHFLHISMLAQNSAQGRASSTGDDALLSSLDFARVGRQGYNEETVRQLRKNKSNVSEKLWLAVGGSSWALAVPYSVYAVLADQKSMRTYRNIYITCGGAATFLLSAGVYTASGVYSGVVNGFHNTTGI
jgi:hypothetical protein